MTTLPEATRIGRMAALSASKATPRRKTRYEPMETKRNWLNRTLILLALLSWAVVFLGYWVAT